MEPIRFADILFTALTLLITYGILFLVNKARQKKNQPLQGAPSSSSENDKSPDRSEEQLKKES
ncbi:MAG: hypothetical protein OQK97_08085 [Deltaproteobacteria bacterium]|jgi:hypothetical protein|nr:hypothetical protein [Deltaproteobacteria bacterium]MCW8893134.1 hypothetical protein [Deltaproteobacteria bacterium]